VKQILEIQKRTTSSARGCADVTRALFLRAAGASFAFYFLDQKFKAAIYALREMHIFMM
jgi:hypothetical protein